MFQRFFHFVVHNRPKILPVKPIMIKKVINCLDSLDMLPTIENLPSGIDTYLYKDIDNCGVEISGGEAQKLAIARALYKRYSVYYFR